MKERIEAIARYLCRHDGVDPDTVRVTDNYPKWKDWCDDAKELIAADPATAEIERLRGLLEWVHKLYGQHNLSFADNWYAEVEQYQLEKRIKQ